jgi:hypothetical protein
MQRSLPLARRDPRDEKLRKKIDEETNGTPRALMDTSSTNYAYALAGELRTLYKSKQTTSSHIKDILSLIDQHHVYERIPESAPYGTRAALVKDMLGIDEAVLLSELEERRRIELAQVEEARQGARVDLVETETSYHDDKKSQGAITIARNRAINRAPEPIRDLYTAGLIAQPLAAKLGPKNPTPEAAARVTEIAQVASETAKALPKPTTRTEARAVQRQVNAKVRELLGEPEPTPAERVVRAFEKLADDRVTAIVAAVRRLSPDERRALRDALVPILHLGAE